ncbi:hypothetical protein MMC12_008228, partial [Toensbergia leucococca]|nr:hypothetical protein [Toensbergia leucococca]
MDDLSGLNWTVPATNSTSKPPPLNSPSYYPAFRPTPPLSGRSTPSTLQPLGSKSKLPIEPNARSNSTTPVNDSFANLVSFNSSHTTKNLSLQDQQKIILEQRLKEEENQRKQSNIQIPPRDGHFWDNLGDGRATPNRLTNPPTYAGTDEYGGQKLSNTINRPFVGISNDLRQPQTKQSIEDERDLLSAFDASAPVDSSSNFPVPSQIAKNHVYGGINREAASQKRDNASALEELAGAGADHLDKMDDDPFNLGTVGNKQLINGTSGGKMADDDDDDVLGLLGRPVSEMPPTIPREQRSLDIVTRVDTSDPLDQALAELMDMGFSPDKSSKALATTQSGIDVQAAVGWLLNQAHEDSRDKTASRQSQRDNSESTETSRPRRASRRTTGTETDEPVPAWMRQQNRPDRQKSRSPANGEKDPAQYATELGSNLFKTANTLWKTGTKKLNQAVSELNSDSDSNQPKWMKEGQGEAEERSTRQRKTAVNGSHDASARSQQRPYPTTAVKPNITDEALMLESGDNRPLSSKVLDRSKASSRTRGSDSSRDQSPSILTRSRDQELPPPRFMSQERAKDPKAKLSRYVVEEQTSQAYVSPARRKKPT